MRKKLMKPGLVAVALIAGVLALPILGQSARKDLPDLPKSGVVVPWEDFKAILDKLQAVPAPATLPPPPVDFALSRCEARATVSGSGEQARVSLDFYVQVLNGLKWVEVPVLREGVALSAFTIDGKPAVVYRRRGFYNVALKGTGRRHLLLEYLSSVNGARGSRSLLLRFPQAPVVTADLTIPRGNLDVSVANAVIRSVDRGPGKTTVRAAFQQARDSHVTWSKRVEADDRESKVFGEQACLLSIGEGFIRGRSHVSYVIHGRGVDSFRLELPTDLTVLNVTADGVADWSVVPKPDAEGKSVLTVRLNFIAKKNYSFTLAFEKALEGTTAKVTLPDISLLDVLRDKGFVAVAAATNVEITPVGTIKNAAPVDPSETPPSIGVGSGASVLYSFKYLKHPVVIPISVVKHEDVEVKRTIVESARMTTFLSREGKLITSARYSIKNNRKQYLAIVLPKDAVIWGAYLEDRPVKPALRKDGSVLVPLKKTVLDTAGKLRSFSLEVVYLQPGKRLRSVGSMTAEGPALDVDVLEARWDFFLPRDSKYFGFGGNLHEDEEMNRVFYLGTNAYNLSSAEDLKRIKTKKVAGRTVITDGLNEEVLEDVRLRGAKEKGGFVAGKLSAVIEKQKGRDEQESAETREDKERVQEQYLAPQAPMSNVAAQTYFSSGMVGGRARGVLPVKIGIPADGLHLSFVGRLLTEGEAPELTMHRIPSSWRVPSKGGTLVALLAFLFALSVLILGGKGFEALSRRDKYLVGTGLLLLLAVFLLAGGHRLLFFLALLTAVGAYMGWRYWRKKRPAGGEV